MLDKNLKRKERKMAKQIPHEKLKITDERSYFKPFKYAWAYDDWLKHEQSHWMM